MTARGQSDNDEKYENSPRSSLHVTQSVSRLFSPPDQTFLGPELFPSAPKPPMGFTATHGGMAATSPTVFELAAHVARSDARSGSVTFAGAHTQRADSTFSYIRRPVTFQSCLMIVSDFSFLVVLIATSKVARLSLQTRKLWCRDRQSRASPLTCPNANKPEKSQKSEK